jgi:hypothetical protein
MEKNRIRNENSVFANLRFDVSSVVKFLKRYRGVRKTRRKIEFITKNLFDCEPSVRFDLTVEFLK